MEFITEVFSFNAWEVHKLHCMFDDYDSFNFKFYEEFMELTEFNGWNMHKLHYMLIILTHLI